MVDSKSSAQYHVLFLPSYRAGDVEQGTSLRGAAHKLGEAIESICGGQGICGKCKVRVLENTFQKYNINSHPDHLSPPTDSEFKYSQKHGFRRNERMSCQAFIQGPLINQANIKFSMRTAPGAIKKIRINPLTLKADIELIDQLSMQRSSSFGQGQARGLCGSAVITAVAELLAAGIIQWNMLN